MNKIEFISAGAGSGKTYKLTETLAQALESGSARPHAIMATTFTVKAATELGERVRLWLLEHDRIDLVTAIGQAQIGTVNSVCGQLIKRFCFDLGISPDQKVLSEGQSKRLIKSTLSEHMGAELQAELVGLTHRLGFEQADWSKTVEAVVKAAHENEISPEMLRPMGIQNAEAMLSNWPPPVAGDDPTAVLMKALTQARQEVTDFVSCQKAADANIPKNLMKGLEDLQKLERLFREDRWSWPDWVGAAGLSAGTRVTENLAPVKAAAQAHESHPAFHADVTRYLVLVFNLAAEVLDAYEQAKKALGVLDFSDQEVLLLRALRTSPSVKETLALELDLVLVDEFQDTSPLQLALFVELAKLAKRSVWVGDPKQAIYGFRGTDASLISGVLGAIQDLGGTIGQALKTSRRSTASLVSLSNAVFSSAFESYLKPEQVKLKSLRKDIPNQPAIINWNFNSPRNDSDYLGLGLAVKGLLDSGFMVEDKETNVFRPIQAGDIGVLCRYNEQVNLAVTSLTNWGIPSASPRSGLLGTAEVIFVLACLRRVNDSNDTVATALIMSFTDSSPVDDWLSDRLEYLSKEGEKPKDWKLYGPAAHPLLKRLEELRPNLSLLTPSEALQLAAAESQVVRLVGNWASTAHESRARLANIENLISLSKNYEDECLTVKQPATVSGLLRWLDERAADEDDSRAVSANNSVSVLTYHGAKGLEWPVVVLTSLNAVARSSLWGVRARTLGIFNPQLPLANRFIHCWLKTWGKRSQPQAAVNAEASKIGMIMQEEALEENKRLLYVGMTRARDINIAVSFVRSSSNSGRSWIDEISGASELLFGDSTSLMLPDEQPLVRLSKSWEQNECEVKPPAKALEACHWFIPRPRAQTKPLWFQPSSAVGGLFKVDETEDIGIRLSLAGKPDMTLLGTALHHSIARACVLGSVTTGDTERILANWSVSNNIDLNAVCAQIASFQDWLSKRWPGCPIYVEVPVEANGYEGTRIRGRLDMLVETPKGWILIDHKSNPSGASKDHDLASEHGPQLMAYESALLDATGKPVLQKWLYLPVAGRAIRVTFVDR